MLNAEELLILKGWEDKGVILNLTDGDLAVFAGDSVAFCTCADGRTDTCCHKRRLKESFVIGAGSEAEQIDMAGRILSGVMQHEQDSNRWYAGAAFFARSYKSFDESNARFRRDKEIGRGRRIRKWDDFENIFHWPCGMLLDDGHKLEDLLLMALEAREFLQEGLLDCRIHSYLHIRKTCPLCEEPKQRIFKFNL
ncbi:MAG TPA: hypothetical protein VF817_01660 [Patescibacteria group bacterium]